VRVTARVALTLKQRAGHLLFPYSLYVEAVNE
jgi:hypothetical protein